MHMSFFKNSCSSISIFQPQGDLADVGIHEIPNKKRREKFAKLVRPVGVVVVVSFIVDNDREGR